MKKELNTFQQPSRKKLSGKKQALILLLITLLFLGLIYGIAVFYFNSHFFFGTTINGMQCERMTVDQVKDRMQDYISEYSLTITARNNNTELITAEDLGMTYIDDQGIEYLMEEQNPFAWISYMIHPVSAEVSANMTFDPSIVPSIVDSLDCMQEDYIVYPLDATIIEENGQFLISPEVMGTSIMRDAFINAIIDAVNNGQTELNIEDADLYAKPSVYSTDPALVTKAEYLNKLATAHITYDMGDNRLYTVDSALLKEWIIPLEDGTYGIDEEKAAEFIKQMAYDTDTFGLTHEFTTTSGATITLARGGDYGWVINREQTTAALLEAIYNQTNGTLEPIYKYKAKDRGINDIGDTYVEICIAEQKMWCYKDGELLVETNIVTGSHSEGYDTPSGSVWAIDAKKKDVAFTQFDVDVTFWVPFNGGVGIHDASWRSDDNYVPSTYLTNGSHGCINTPYDAAEKIFNAMDIGYPVVVYYSIDQPVGPQPTQQTSVG